MPAPMTGPRADLSTTAEAQRRGGAVEVRRPALSSHLDRGLFALGDTYALGVDPDTGAVVKHPPPPGQGVRKPIKALMMLATSSGLTTAEWDKELQFNPPNLARCARTTIRKLMGGEDPIREDVRGLLVTDLHLRLEGIPAPRRARSHPGQHRRPHRGRRLDPWCPLRRHPRWRLRVEISRTACATN